MPVTQIKNTPGYEIEDLHEFVNTFENPDSDNGTSKDYRPGSQRISSNIDSQVVPLNMTSDGTMSLIRRTYSDGNNFDKPNDENENMIKSDMSFTSDGDVP